MLADYRPFLDRMIHKYEGGYGWNKKDAGGPTNFGITCFDLAEHRNQKMTSMAAWADPVRTMTLQEAEDIYQTKYANALMFNGLRAGVDVTMLDYGVNSGNGRPVAVARAITGVKGGRMDATLVDAINSIDPNKFIDAMDDERLHFMHGIRGGSDWAEFGRGWSARVADVRAYAKHLTSGSALPAPAPPDLSHVVQPKAVHQPKTATGPTMGGAVTGPVAAHAAGAPWWAVGAIGVGIVVIGVAYEAYEERHAATLNNTVVLPTKV